MTKETKSWFVTIVKDDPDDELKAKQTEPGKILMKKGEPETCARVFE